MMHCHHNESEIVHTGEGPCEREARIERLKTLLESGDEAEQRDAFARLQGAMDKSKFVVRPVSRAEALQSSRRILEQAEAERTAQVQSPAVPDWRLRIVCPCCGWAAPENRKRVIECSSCGATSAGDYLPTLGELVDCTDTRLWVEVDVSAFLRSVLKMMKIKV